MESITIFCSVTTARVLAAWNRLGNWIPNFSSVTNQIALCGVILAPVEERGFLVRLEATNHSSEAVELTYGLRGRWASSWHCINEDKVLGGEKYCYRSEWNQSIVFDMRCGTPMFAFAPMADQECESTFTQAGDAVDYRLARSETLLPGQRCVLTVYWGIGFEEVAATTSAKEILRQGYDYELTRTLEYLAGCVLQFKDEKLTSLYNTNLFFCMFFSTGITLDTEELVLVTSRSPRYYVSAAYWDRDSLLWSFPAILSADPLLARDMLLYVYGRQRRNFGVHSRYIDGTVLEPGFELDELMAPVIALKRYVDGTGDRTILEEIGVKTGIAEILQKLAKHRHADTALYDTFLQPTDDDHVYPYLTYDNVLVWNALRAIAHLYPGHRELEQTAEDVKNAIAQHCVKEENGKRFYAWSVDLNGHYDIYDEPPGSLQILPYLGFCTVNDEVYRNTVGMLNLAALSFKTISFFLPMLSSQINRENDVITKLQKPRPSAYKGLRLGEVKNMITPKSRTRISKAMTFVFFIDISFLVTDICFFHKHPIFIKISLLYYNPNQR